ncbi:MAG: hypothetical protein ACE5NW_15545 [Acidiferrobacterales bacterium]
MFELLRLYFKFVFLSVGKRWWLQWILGVSFIVVVLGLIPILREGADPLMPFGVSVLDLAYGAALCVLFLGFAFVLVSVIGIPLFRYNGVCLILLGIGVLGYQVYGFVRLGEWQPFSIRDFTDALFLTWSLDQPTGWAKAILKEFLEETALSLFFIACGMVWHFAAKKILDNELRDLKEAESEGLAPFGEAKKPKGV